MTIDGHYPKEVRLNQTHLQCNSEEPNYLRRAFEFTKWIEQGIEDLNHLRVAVYRDIWGGLAFIRKDHLMKVFEVNGLPSIELPYRYPSISQSTLARIIEIEDKCLATSDMIICPSQTIKDYLISQSVLPEKIKVISNGADIIPRFAKPQGLPDKYIVYFGALQPWQGVDTLIKSLNYLTEVPELKLVICSSHKEKFSKLYVKLANRLRVNDRIIWKHKLKKPDLFPIVQHAKASLIPLTECSRNLNQGCSPLKIFESMACKTPIIASDIPVVREILSPEKEAKLFRPERPAELARQMKILLEQPDLATGIAERAYQKLIKFYTWEQIDQKLSEFYDNLVRLAFTSKDQLRS